MPLLNRVDPFGHITAHAARGTRMGNRGILHDEAGTVVRIHAHQNWVCCLTSFKGRKRALMQPGHYTELFFLDEATALAAGHRPCGECQRDRYRAYAGLWVKVHALPEGVPVPRAIDRALHRARISHRRKVTFEAKASDLPEGTMVAVADVAFLLWKGRVWRWSFEGYTEADALPLTVTVLTPAPSVAVLRAGYVPETCIPP
ncbi:hypothetical protein [Sagittula salina]|uniref:Uncharacterized protein n=1 Tax=Sagittula salina TaxID=2820268 RepID=A0A940MR53_9RHOB|nr:hypothetical protein [Sagittula salina]MBP0481529.1 hypothetical protein [Sagittula salina]